MPADVQASGGKRVKLNSYAAKAVCSIASKDFPISTILNIHNPKYKNVKFFWKVVPAYPIGSPQKESVNGNGPELYPGWLYADGAASIDCNYISKFFGYKELEGFIVILSQDELDVVGYHLIGNLEYAHDHEIVPVTPTKITVSRSLYAQWDQMPDMIP
jgi:hypothetical protein